MSDEESVREREGGERAAGTCHTAARRGPRTAACGDGLASPIKQSWSQDTMASPLPPVARREMLLGLVGVGASAVAKGQDPGSPGSSLVYSTFRRRRVAGVLPRGRLATNKTHRLPALTSTSPALLQSHLDVHPCHFDLGTEEGLHRKLFLSSLVLLWLPYLLSTYHGRTYLLIYRTEG